MSVTMPPRTLVHVADMEIHRHTGMGRISHHWREAFLERGWKFVEIGSREVGPVPHRALWHRHAWSYFERLKIDPAMVLVHEPASGVFTGRGFPVALFSHGIEERGRRVMKPILREHGRQPSIRARLKSLLTGPLWARRAAQCERGLRHADLLFLSNTEDRQFVEEEYGRSPSDVCVFKNGVYPSSPGAGIAESEMPTILFLGTWNDRKGAFTLIEAARLLHRRGLRLRYLLAGVQVPAAAILAEWPEELRAAVEIVESFPPEREAAILDRASLFVLPSLVEGQPLVLLQAMERGLCCVATDACGQKDLLREKENGLLFDLAEAPALAEQIGWAIAHPEEARRFGVQARREMEDRSWPIAAGELVGRVETWLASHS